MCCGSLPVMIEISLETKRKNIKCSFNFFNQLSAYGINICRAILTCWSRMALYDVKELLYWSAYNMGGLLR